MNDTSGLITNNNDTNNTNIMLMIDITNNNDTYNTLII